MKKVVASSMIQHYFVRSWTEGGATAFRAMIGKETADD